MDIITLDRDRYDPDRVRAFEQKAGVEKGLQGEGALLALSGDALCAEGRLQVSPTAPHRAVVELASDKDTQQEVFRVLLEALAAQAAKQEVTLLLYFAPAGDCEREAALRETGYTMVGTIPGYFRQGGVFDDAVLWIQDLRTEEDEEDRQRSYIAGMIRDGYDNGNIAWFCGTDEETVQLIREELGIPEPD